MPRRARSAPPPRPPPAPAACRWQSVSRCASALGVACGSTGTIATSSRRGSSARRARKSKSSASLLACRSLSPSPPRDSLGVHHALRFGRLTLRCVLQPRCCGGAVAALTSVIGSAAATCRADLIKRTQRLHEKFQSCLVPGSHLRGSHGDGGHCGVQAIVTAGAVATR